MGRFTRRARPVVTIMLMAMGLSLTGGADLEAQGGWSARDAAAIKGHTLTMDKLRRMNGAVVEFDRLEKSRPDLGDDEDEVNTIDGLVARIDAVPEARAILKKHGLTTREYVLTLFASTHAAAGAFMEANGQQAAGVPVSRAQIDFYKANKAELDKLDAARKAATGSDDEDEDGEE
jgi:hypothetical protein